MEFALHFPGPPLDRHIESITYYSGFAPNHDREKLLPDGAIQIIVDLTDTPKKLYASETSPQAVDFRKSWISGLQRRWIVIEAQQQSSMMVIRFRPAAAYPFLQHDADALSNAVYSLEDVMGKFAVSLRDRVLAAPTRAAKFAAAESWLLERASRSPAVNSAAAWLTSRLRHSIGARVGDLAEETGYTERHVQNLFRRWVGITPKQYARISRFQRLLQNLAVNAAEDPAMLSAPLPEPDWAQMALATGYYDQSHMANEFRALAGTTPGAYVAAYRGLTNYLPITLPR